MVITFPSDPDQVVSQVEAELIGATKDRRHPFRFFALSTVYENKPCARTVVLRRVLDGWVIRMYCDARSQKLKHWEANPVATALFYHPRKQFQLSLETEVVIHKEGDVWEGERERVPEFMEKDYQSTYSSGTRMNWLANTHALDASLYMNFFRVADLRVITWDALQLNQMGHIRFRGTRTSNKTWEVNRVIP